MSACNYTAPNGQPSILAARLSEIYPEDKVRDIWMRAKTLRAEDRQNKTDLGNLENRMLRFLQGLNVSVKEFDDLKEMTGFDVVGVTDMLYRVVGLGVNRDDNTLARETAYVAYSFLGKKNKIRTDLVHSIENMENYEEIFEKYSDKSPNLPAGKIKELITIDFLADAIRNNYKAPKQSYLHRKSEFWNIQGNSNFEKRINYLLAKFMKFVKDFFSGSMLSKEKLYALADDIANDILTGNFEKYQTELSNNAQLTNYEETIKRDPVAKKIVEDMQKMGMILTGSLALRKQGTLYRSTSENLHDLDFTVPYELIRPLIESTSREMVEEFRRTGKEIVFEEKMKVDLTKSSWMRNIKALYPDFKITNVFHENNDPEGNITVTGKTGEHVIDFFVKTNPTDQFDKNKRGFQDWQKIFAAKIKMGRAKDLLDFVHFNPAEVEQGQIAQYSGLRHFSFRDINGEPTLEVVAKSIGLPYSAKARLEELRNQFSSFSNIRTKFKGRLDDVENLTEVFTGIMSDVNMGKPFASDISEEKKKAIIAGTATSYVWQDNFAPYEKNITANYKAEMASEEDRFNTWFSYNNWFYNKDYDDNKFYKSNSNTYREVEISKEEYYNDLDKHKQELEDIYKQELADVKEHVLRSNFTEGKILRLFDEHFVIVTKHSIKEEGDSFINTIDFMYYDSFPIEEYTKLKREFRKVVQSKDSAPDPNKGQYFWKRYADNPLNGYEVSSAGDRRFSALYAKLQDGRTIEEAYQLDVKGYRSKGNDWKLGKGKKPLRNITPEEQWQEYKALWAQYLKENPQLRNELAVKAEGKILTDKFATTDISQARALAELLREQYKQTTELVEEPVKETTTPKRTYTGLITKLESNQVFVFGSNPLGINGNPAKGTGGAALVATTNGWVNQGEKMDNKLSSSGKAFGITTVTGPGKKRSKTADEIKEGIKKLYDLANANPNNEYLVAYTGTGTNLNGYSNRELAEMFSSYKIPSNVIFEKEFSSLLVPTIPAKETTAPKLSSPDTSSPEGFKKSIETAIKIAEKHPDIEFVLPLTNVRSNKRVDKMTGMQIAEVLSEMTLPKNLKADYSLQALVDNTYKRVLQDFPFSNTETAVHDEEKANAARNRIFIPKVNAAGEQEGNFSAKEISDITDSFVYHVQLLSGNKELRVADLFAAIRKWYQDRAILAEKARPEQAANFNYVLNSFEAFSNRAIKKLSLYGWKMADDAKSKLLKAIRENKLPEVILEINTEDGSIMNAIPEGEQEYTEDRGGAAKDWSDVSFEVDPRDTASTRVKLMLASIQEGTFGVYTYDEKGKSAAQVIKLLEQRSGMKIASATDLRNAMAVPAARAVLPGIAGQLSGKPFSLPDKNIGLALQQYLIENHKVNSSSTMYGPKLVNFDQFFQDLLGLLGNQERNAVNYMKLLLKKGENVPHFLTLYEKLMNAPDKSIVREFCSVMTKQYQPFMLMWVTQRIDDKEQRMMSMRPIEANRATLTGTIIKMWQEDQKNSPLVIVKDGVRQMDLQRIRGKHVPIVRALGMMWNDIPNAKGATRDKLKGEIVNMLVESGMTEAEAYSWFTHNSNGENLAIESRDWVQKMLSTHGIVMSKKQMQSLMTNMGDWTEGTAMAGGIAQQFAYNQVGRATGMFSSFVEKAAGNRTNNWEEDDINDQSDFARLNPLYTEPTTMEILAKVFAAGNKTISPPNFRSSEDKSIYAYGANSELSHRWRTLTNKLNGTQEEKNQLLADMNKVFMLADNSMISRLLKFGAQNTELMYLDGIKASWKKKGTVRTKMSEREQLLTSLSMFMNQGKARGYFMSLSHSDKTTTPIFKNIPKFDTIDPANGLAVTPKVIAEIKGLVIGEYSRVLNHRTVQFNDNKYEDGKGLFYTLPEMNFEEVKKSTILTDADKEALYDKSGVLKPLTKEAHTALDKLIAASVTKMSDRVYTKMVNAGITLDMIDNDALKKITNKLRADRITRVLLDGTVRYDYLRKDNNTLLTEEEILGAIAKDYAVNHFVFNVQISRMMFGDPAQMYKGKKGTPQKDQVNATMKEYAKRLAKSIAPGQDGFWDKPTYKSLTADDVWMKDNYIRRNPELSKYYGKIESTNAQEVTTVQEHLDVLRAFGRITDDKYKELSKVITDANGGYYEFTAEQMKVILQPQKPVYSWPRPEKNNAMLYDYVKSSSYPLLPQYTKGMEIDNLRMLMENEGIQRTAFVSGKKVGAPSSPVALFDADNKWVSPEEAEWRKSVQVLSRDGFRLQQDVPYDETKEAIKTVSQMNKLVVEGVSRIRGLKVKLNGETFTGSEILNKKEDIRKKLISKNLTKLCRKLGIKVTPDGNTHGWHDKSKVWKLLKEEAISRGYGYNEVETLSELINGEPAIPFLFNPSFAKLESLMMSLFKTAVSVKMPGKSFVQGSSFGFTRENFRTLDSIDTAKYNGITWVEGYEGRPLRHMEKSADGKTVTPAEVLVPWNFFTEQDGVKVKANIRDFMVPGTDMLDMNKIPKELLEMVGARIPNQGHNSMIALKVVGFLPENMGDLIIVPGAITDQMGSDFDVDKLFTYKRGYTFADGVFSVAKEKEKSQERLGADNDEYQELKSKAKQLLKAQGVKPNKKGQYMKDEFNKALGAMVKEKYKDGEIPKHVFTFPAPTRDKAKIEFLRNWMGEEGTDEELLLRDETVAEEDGITLGEAIDRLYMEQRDDFYTEDEASLKNQYFDLHWQILVHPDMYEKIMKPLDKPDLKEEAEILSKGLDSGNYFDVLSQLEDFTSGKDAKALVGLTSLSVTFNAVIQDKNLFLGDYVWNEQEQTMELVPVSILIKDNDGIPVGLTNLSGHGTSMYGTEKRSKADNLTSLQSAAVDNAKDRTLDNLNLTTNTYYAAAALVQLQTSSEWSPNLQYVTRLLTQPIIKEFQKKMTIGGDSISRNFSKDLYENVITQLRESLEGVANKETAEGIVFDTDTLLKCQDANFKDHNEHQLAALNLFDKLYRVGKRLSEIQSLINSDVKGAGKNIYAALDKFEKRAKVEQVPVFGVEALFRNADKTLTEQGLLFQQTIGTVTSYLTEVFPYELMQPIADYVKQESGKPRLTETETKLIFNALRSKLLSQLWPNAAGERARILFTTKDNNSLAQRLSELKRVHTDNYFLQHLDTELSPTGGPEYVTYKAYGTQEFDNEENTNGWAALLYSPNEELRQLGEDLVKYAYLTGGNQDTNAFIKFIPSAWVLSSGLASRMQTMYKQLKSDENEKGSFGHAETAVHAGIRTQFYQHNPEMAKEITAEVFGNFANGPHPVFFTPAESALDNLYVKEMIGSQAVKRPPRYLYFRSTAGNVLYTYQRGGYLQVDILGNEFTDEYNEHSGLSRSLFPENRVPTSLIPALDPEGMVIEELEVMEIPQKKSNNKFADLGLVGDGGTREDVQVALDRIAGNSKIPQYLRSVAKLYKNTQKHLDNEITKNIQGTPFSWGYGPVAGAGQYDTKDNKITLNPKAVKTLRGAAETLLHEITHERLLGMIVAMGFDREAIAKNPWIEKFIETNRKAHPKVVEHLEALEALRKKAYFAFVQRMEQEGKNVFDMMADLNNKDPKKFTEDTLLLYALSDLHEFTSHVMSSPMLATFLNSIDGSGKKPFLQQVFDLFAEILAAFGKALGVTIRDDSALKEALHHTIALTSYQDGDYNNVSQGIDKRVSMLDTEFNAEFTRYAEEQTQGNKVIIEEDEMGYRLNITKEAKAPAPTSSVKEIRRLLSKLTEQRDKMWEAFGRTKDIRKKEALKHEIRILENQMMELSRKGELEYIQDMGARQLAWVEKLIANEFPTAFELNLALKIADNWKEIIDILFEEIDKGEGLDQHFKEIIGKAAVIRKEVINKQRRVYKEMMRSKGMELGDDAFTTNVTNSNFWRTQTYSVNTSPVKIVQSIASVMQDAANTRDSEIMRLAAELEDMQKLFEKSGARNTDFLQENEEGNAWGLVQEHSQDWFDFRSKLKADKSWKLKHVDKSTEETKAKNKRKRKIWQEYWKELKKAAVFIDVNIFFDINATDPEGNVLNSTSKVEAEKARLAPLVGGTDVVERLLVEAEEKYRRYLRRKMAFYEEVDVVTELTSLELEEAAKANLTADDALREKKNARKKSWRDFNSPFLFMEGLNGKFVYNTINQGDNYLTVVPNVKEKKFYDEKFISIMKDPAKKQIYEQLKDVRDRLRDYLPENVEMADNFLPVVDQSLVDTMFSYTGIKSMLSKDAINEKLLQAFTSTPSQIERVNPDRIPIMYLESNKSRKDKTKEEFGERSQDLPRIMEIFGMMAIHFRHMNRVLDDVQLAQNILNEINVRRQQGLEEGPQVQNTIASLNYFKDVLIFRKPKEVEGNTGLKVYSLNLVDQNRIVKEVQTLSAEKKNILTEWGKQVEENPMLEMSITSDDPYPGMSEKDSKRLTEIDKILSKHERDKRFITGSSIGDSLIAIGQLKALSYNPFSAAANLTMAMVSASVYARGGVDYTAAQLRKAQGIMLHASKKYYGLGKDPTANKIENFMMRLGLMGDTVDSQYGSNLKTHKKPRWMDALSPYNWQKSGDFYTKGSLAIAIAMNTKVKVGDTEINLWEALNNDGEWDAEKYGPDPEWGSADPSMELKWNKFRNKTRKVSQIVFGNQDKNSPLLARKTVVGRLLGQFRLSWFPEAIRARWSDEQMDYDLDRVTKGRYRTYADLGVATSGMLVGKLWLNSLLRRRENVFEDVINKKTGEGIAPVDIENMRKNAAGMAWTMAFLGATMLLKSMMPDDKEKRKRKKKDQDAQMKAIMVMLNLSTRNWQDLSMYSSPAVLDQVLRNPVPAIAVIRDFKTAVVAGVSIWGADTDKEFKQEMLRITRAFPFLNLYNKFDYMTKRDLGAINR